MHRQVKPIAFGFGIDAQREDQANQFDQDKRYNKRKHTHNEQPAQLRGPAALSEQSDHHRAKNSSDAVYGKNIQRIIDIENIAHKIDRFLA